MTGICTSCGKESTLLHAEHNGKITCPHCKRELTVKSAGKMGRYYGRDTVQVIERTGDDEIVVRIVKVYYDYGSDRLIPAESISENACVFVRRSPDGKTVAEPYYYSGDKGTLTHWMSGARPVFSYYQYNFAADLAATSTAETSPAPWPGPRGNTAPWRRFMGTSGNRCSYHPSLPPTWSTRSWCT